jgi:hypothetical protein
MEKNIENKLLTRTYFSKVIVAELITTKKFKNLKILNLKQHL